MDYGLPDPPQKKISNIAYPASSEYLDGETLSIGQMDVLFLESP